jgi:hypothetical protein
MPSSSPKVTQISFSKRFMVEIQPETYLQLQKLSKVTGLPHKIVVRVALDQWGQRHFKEAKKWSAQR